MFAPTKTYRRWHRRVNVNQKRYAICSAIAASGVSSLVMAKGEESFCLSNTFMSMPKFRVKKIMWP